MKKLKKIIIISCMLFFITGCTKPEEKITKSIEYLNDETYYIVHNGLRCDEKNVNISASFTFDEMTGISEKDIDKDNIPYSTEMVKFNEQTIERYYGFIKKNLNYEDTYYLEEWFNEELELTEENKEKYTYLDKTYYIDMINNAIEYDKFEGTYRMILSKDSVQKIVDKISEEKIIVNEDEVYANVSFEEDNLNILNISFFDEEFNIYSLSISFQTEFDEEDDEILEFPILEEIK